MFHQSISGPFEFALFYGIGCRNRPWTRLERVVLWPSIDIGCCFSQKHLWHGEIRLLVFPQRRNLNWPYVLVTVTVLTSCHLWCDARHPSNPAYLCLVHYARFVTCCIRGMRAWKARFWGWSSNTHSAPLPYKTWLPATRNGQASMWIGTTSQTKWRSRWTTLTHRFPFLSWCAFSSTTRVLNGTRLGQLHKRKSSRFITQ